MTLSRRRVNFPSNVSSSSLASHLSSDDDGLLVDNRRFQVYGYFKQHILYIILLPVLIFLPYLIYTYGIQPINDGPDPIAPPTWYYLSLFDWTMFVISNVLCLLLISLFVRIFQDISVQLTPRRQFYIVRVLRRSRTRIILSLYFLSALIILDFYTPTECQERHTPPELPKFNNLSPDTFSSDPILNSIFEQLKVSFASEKPLDPFTSFIPEKYNELYGSFHSDNENDRIYSSCIYSFSVARKLIKCALVTLIGISFSKIIVMLVSILYQDQVYRERILLNKYHVFITQLLFSACRFEGAKKGLLYTPAKISPKRPRSAFFANNDENVSIFQEESGDEHDNYGAQNEDDEQSEVEANTTHSRFVEDNDNFDEDYQLNRDYSSEYDSNSNNNSYSSTVNGRRGDRDRLRPVTTPVVQARGLVRALRFLFRIQENSSDNGNINTESQLLTERDWVNFSTFRKNVGVFGPDFSLMIGKERSPSEAGLPPAECKRRAKFVYDVLTHGKEVSIDGIQLSSSKFAIACKPALSSSTGEPLLPGGYSSKDLLLSPVHQGDFYRLFRSKEAASEVYSVFDLNLDGNITRSELEQVFTEVHQCYRNLIRSVSSSAEALRALDLVLSVSISLILLLIYCLIWGANITSILTLTLSFILALNVVIGDWAKNAFDSLMFLFVCHSFDIGDEVTIEGDPKRYTVSRVYVLKTAMRDSSGVEVYMPNPSLLRKNITNWKRSNEQWEQVSLYLGCDTTEEQIYAFRARLTEFLKTQGKHLFHGQFEPEFTPVIGDNLDILSLRFRIPCKLTLDTRRRAERHRLLQNYIRSDLEYIGITYYPRGPSSTPLSFYKEKSSFMKAFSKAARKDPLLAEDAAGIAVTMHVFQPNTSK